jgi:hypothetical protein
MEKFSETQYWLVVAAVVLTPMLAFWIIEVTAGYCVARFGVTWTWASVGRAPAR